MSKEKKKKSFFARLTGAKEKKIKKNKIIKAKKPVIEKIEMPQEEGQLAIDVFQTEDDIVIKSTIAGVKPEDIDIDITNDMVTIKGKREQKIQVKAEDYYYQECYWGSFSRSVILPVEVLAEKAKAKMNNGVLTIYLPKAEKLKSRKILIKAE